jgi:hypothetical protein
MTDIGEPSTLSLRLIHPSAPGPSANEAGVGLLIAFLH